MQLSFTGFDNPKALIKRNHYTGSWPSGKSHTYLFEDAVVVISIPANPYVSKWLRCRVWELSRLWAPDGHGKNLLTQAISHSVKRFKQFGIADAVISYADPNAGHAGGVYRAASWIYLGQSEDGRAWLAEDGRIVPRRKFHAGREFLRKPEIIALGYTEIAREGKHRFVFPLTKFGRAAVAAKLTEFDGSAIRNPRKGGHV